MRTRRSHRRRANSGGSRSQADTLTRTLALTLTLTLSLTLTLTLTRTLARTLTQVARLQRREPHPHRRRAEGAAREPGGGREGEG